MIDNICIVVPVENGSKWYKSSNIKDLHSPHENCYNGYLRNFYIRQDMDGIILSGSLAKFLNGENMTPLKKKGKYIDEIKESLELLQKESGIKLDSGYVRSIEVGTSIIVKYPVASYLSQVGRYGKRYKMMIVCDYSLESILYTTRAGSYSFQMYDKTKEMSDKNKKNNIPDVYKNQNVIRLEYKIKKRSGIIEQFGKDLKPVDLYKNEIYEKLQSLFEKFYFTIPKCGNNIYMSKIRNITPSMLEKIQCDLFTTLNPDCSNFILGNANINEKNKERIRYKQRLKPSWFSIEPNLLMNELNIKVKSSV